MLDYIHALIYAAEAGQAHLPRVKIELSASHHGLILSSDYGSYHTQRIVSWDALLDSKAPLSYLVNEIVTVRASMNKATP